MICCSCCDGKHGECRGGTWCDCQHATGRAVPPRTEVVVTITPDMTKIDAARVRDIAQSGHLR